MHKKAEAIAFWAAVIAIGAFIAIMVAMYIVGSAEEAVDVPGYGQYRADPGSGLGGNPIGVGVNPLPVPRPSLQAYQVTCEDGSTGPRASAAIACSRDGGVWSGP
jgi:hypothetical protein